MDTCGRPRRHAQPRPGVQLLLLLLLVTVSLPGRATSLVMYVDQMEQGQALLAGSELLHPPYTLLMQRDCNLVLYKDTAPLWASQTATTGDNCYFLLQSDGNGVIYNSYEKPVFATETAGRNDGKHTITLQGDGNVVMTNEHGDAIWATNTANR